MSWFGNDEVAVDTRVNETVEEGVRIERRSLLRLSGATLASAFAMTACATSPVKRGARSDKSAEPLSAGALEIGELLSEMHPQAQRIIKSGGEREEAYLMRVSELLARLRIPTQAELRSAMRSFGESREGDGLQIWIVMMSLEAGKGFSHHDHRDYNGVILGVEGEAQVKNFDILGDNLVPPAGETFQIRQTRDDLILPGRFSSLGCTRENVHSLIAGPEGATVVDAFTFFKPGARSYNMDVESEPRDAERRIYDAAWS